MKGPKEKFFFYFYSRKKKTTTTKGNTMVDGSAAAAAAIEVGCFVPVQKGPSGDKTTFQRAEILSIRGGENGLDTAEFYVHYDGFNKV